jgi:hypothetical protein
VVSGVQTWHPGDLVGWLSGVFQRDHMAVVYKGCRACAQGFLDSCRHDSVTDPVFTQLP